MVLSIAEFTNDELHGSLGADEGAVAQRAVATDAIRPKHIRTVPPEQKHAISMRCGLCVVGDEGHSFCIVYHLSPFRWAISG